MNKASHFLIKSCIKSSVVRPTIFGEHHIDQQIPTLFMANHARFYGPIVASCYFPFADKMWATFEVIEPSLCREYTTRTLFRERLEWNKTISSMCGYMVGGLLAGLMQHEPLIPAYWEPQRARKSINLGVQAAVEGNSQIMFARNTGYDKGSLDNSFDFERGYQLIIHQLAKKHQQYIHIHPVAINRKNHTVAIGPHTAITPEQSIKDEKRRIHDYLVWAVKVGHDSPEKLANLKSDCIIVE